MSNAVRKPSTRRESDVPAESLEKIVAQHSTPEFTEAILDHFHEAKRRALGDIREAGLKPATETENAHR